MRLGSALACAGVSVAAILLSHGTAGAAEELLRRMVPTETMSGVVGIRDAFEVDAETPAPCEDGTRECTAPRRFPRVMSLEFEVELAVVEDGVLRRSRESRGSIHIGLGLEPDDERAFGEELVRQIESLGAAAFHESFAGLRQELASTRLGSLSAEPSFVCFESEGRTSVVEYVRHVEEQEDGTERVIGASTIGYSGLEAGEALCARLAGATAPSQPRRVSTLAMPLVLSEVSAWLESASFVGEDVHRDDLAPLPTGASVSVAPHGQPGVSGSSNSVYDGRYESTRTQSGVTTKTTTQPGDLPASAVRGPAWIGRFTIERRRHLLGARPETSAQAESSLLVVLLPTAPPVELDADGSPVDAPGPEYVSPRFDTDAFAGKIATELERTGDITTDAIEPIVTADPEGLGETAWILVVCRPDGTASYWLPTSPAHSLLTNPDLFCPEAESRLGRDPGR